MMLDDLNFFDAEMTDVAEEAKPAAKKKVLARAGCFRWTLRAGMLALSVAVTSVSASPNAVASLDGRRAAVEVAQAMHKFGVMPVNLRRDAAVAKRVLRPVEEKHDFADPDYGF